MFRPQRPVSVCAGETESANLIYQKPIVTAINDTPVGIVTSDNKSDKVITISANEWNALNEKVFEYIYILNCNEKGKYTDFFITGEQFGDTFRNAS